MKISRQRWQREKLEGFNDLVYTWMNTDGSGGITVNSSADYASDDLSKTQPDIA
jgi:hypothetical protein